MAVKIIMYTIRKEVSIIMRLSGLIVGGLIGAAATVYFSNRRPGAMAWAGNALSDVSSKVASKSMSKIWNAKWNAGGAAAMAPKRSDDTAASSEAAWEQIEAIVESDPVIKKEAAKIKAESSSVAH
ncbi:hypothetical protein [Paenibacillus harenae]|uniref:hypothetical protein n=1 Tax=Paenibacillus harenae TaxID=306543 RepID=UPI0012ECB517|nr:hypothetical protein [Paenibacillus harenae]